MGDGAQTSNVYAEEIVSEVGVRPEVANSFGTVASELDRWARNYTLEDESGEIVQTTPPPAETERFINERVVVTSENDPRVGTVSDLGDGRGQRLFVTRDDYDRFLRYVMS